MSIKVNFHSANGIEKSLLVKLTFGKEKAVVVARPDSGVWMEFIDEATGVAPQRIFTKRSGDDLAVYFDDKTQDSEPELIVKDYYNGEMAPILGKDVEGVYHAYVSELGKAELAIAELAPEMLAAQILAKEAFVFTPFFPAWWLIGGTLGAAGLAALALGSSGNGGSGDNGSSKPASVTFDKKTDPADGSVSFPIPPKAKTIEITYTDSQGNTITSTVTQNEDGTYSSTDKNIEINNSTNPKTVGIKEENIANNSEVKVVVTYENGEKSDPATTTTNPYDKETNEDIKNSEQKDANGELPYKAPKVVRMYDNSSSADGNPETFELEGRTRPNAVVEILDPKGNLLFKGRADATTGKYHFTVQEHPSFDLQVNKGHEFTVITKADGFAPSTDKAPITGDIPMIFSGDKKGPETPPSLEVENGVATITPNPKGTQGGEQNKSTETEFTSKGQPEGQTEKDKLKVTTGNPIEVVYDPAGTDNPSVNIKKTTDEKTGETHTHADFIPKGETTPINTDVKRNDKGQVTETQASAGDTTVKVTFDDKGKPTGTTVTNPDGTTTTIKTENGTTTVEKTNPDGSKETGGTDLLPPNVEINETTGEVTVTPPTTGTTTPNSPTTPPTISVGKDGTISVNTGNTQPTEAVIDPKGTIKLDTDNNPETKADVVIDDKEVKIDNDRDDKTTNNGTGGTDDTNNTKPTDPITIDISGHKDTTGTVKIPTNTLDTGKTGGTEISVTGKDLAGNSSETTTKVITEPGSNKADTPKAPTLEALDGAQAGALKLTPPADAENGTEVVVMFTKEEDGTEVTAVLKKEGNNWVDVTEPASDRGLLTQNTDGTFTIEENKIKDASDVFAHSRKGDDHNNKSETVHKEVLPDEQTELRDVEITSYNNSTPAKLDDITKVKVVATTDPNAKVQIKDEAGKVIAEGTADAQGNFAIEFAEPTGSEFIGDTTKLTVVATEPSKKPSDPVEKTVPTIAPDGTGYVGDKMAPEAPTLTVGEASKNDVTVAPKNPQPGDVLNVGVTLADGTKTTYTFTVGKDGKLTQTSPNPTDATNTAPTPKISADGKSVTFDKGTLQDNTPITATVKDIAGNVSDPALGNSGFDNITDTPTISGIEAKSTVLNLATKNPNHFIVKGKAEPNSLVTVTDENGKALKQGKADANGDFTIAFDEPTGVDIQSGDKLKVIAQAVTGEKNTPTKAPSQASAPKVVPVLTKDDYADKTAPQQPEISEPLGNGDLPVKLPKDTVVGDRATIEVGKDTNGDGKLDSADNPKTVTLEKQADGSWKPLDNGGDKSLIKSINGDTVLLPNEKVPAGAMVEVEVVDVAGNSANSTDIVNKPQEKTKKPTVTEITATDASAEADNVIDYVTLKGITENAGATVKVVYNGKEYTTTSGADKSFTLQIKAEGLKPGITFEVTAKDADKLESDPTTTLNGTANPIAVPTTIEYLDSVPPKAPVIDNKNTDGNVPVKLPESAVKGNTATITVGDKTLEFTHTGDPTNPWTLTKGDESLVKTPISGNTVELKDVAEGTQVTATVKDNAGRTSDEAKKTITTTPTEEPSVPVKKANPPIVKSIKSINTDTEQDGNPEQVLITGTTDEPGATVYVRWTNPLTNEEVIIGQATSSTEKDENNKYPFTVTAIEPNGADVKVGDKLKITAKDKGENQVESEPAQTHLGDETRVPAVGFDKASNPFDNTPPKNPTVDTNTGQNGDPEAVVDLSGMKPGETTEITKYSGGDANKDGLPDNKTTTTVTKKPDGTFEIVGGEANNGTGLTIGQNGTATVPVKSGDVVTAKTTDANGNSSETDKEVIKTKTDAPTEISIKAVDKSNSADEIAEEITVTGKVPDVPVGTPVTIRNAKGEVVGTGKTTDDDGNFTIVIPNDKFRPPLKEDDTIYVTAEDKTNNKAPSDAVQTNVPAVPPTAEGHPNDPTGPSAPELIPVAGTGAVILKFPTDANPGDTVEVSYKKEDGTDAKVIFEKQTDGSWESKNPTELPSVVENLDSPQLIIPENHIQDGQPVTAKSIDKFIPAPEGEKSISANAGDDVKTATPTNLKIVSKDTDANGEVDTMVITGSVDETAEGATEAIIYRGETELARVPVVNGKFTATIPETMGDIVAGQTITVVAKNPNKELSKQATAVVPDVMQPPVFESIESYNNESQANVTPEKVVINVTHPVDGTIIEVQDSTGKVVGTGTIQNGKAAIELVEGSAPAPTDIQANDTFTLVAKDPTNAKDPSAATSTTPVQPVPTGAGTDKYHPNDNTAPTAPTVTPAAKDDDSADSDGSLTVTFPPTSQAEPNNPAAAVPGDVVEVKYTPTGATEEVTASYTLGDDFTWKPNANNPTSAPAVTQDANNKPAIKFDEGVLKDNTPVTTSTKDQVGKTAEKSGMAPFDLKSAKPTITEIKGIDVVKNGEDANTDPEQMLVKVTTVQQDGTKAPEGSIVKIYAEGTDTPIATGVVGADGTANILVKEPDVQIIVGGEFVATVQEVGEDKTTPVKAESQPSDPEAVKAPKNGTIKDIDNDNDIDVDDIKAQEGGHIGDTTPPTEEQMPKVTAVKEGENAGAANIELPKDVPAGYRVEVEFTPEKKVGPDGRPTAEDNNSNPPEKVTVTLTVDENGNWTSDKPALIDNVNKPTDPNAKPTAVIPKDTVKDNTVVTATIKDLADNKPQTPSQDTTAFDEKTATPVINDIKGISTENTYSDKTPEKFRIEAVVEANSLVTAEIEVNGQKVEIARFDLSNDADKAKVTLEPQADGKVKVTFETDPTKTPRDFKFVTEGDNKTAINVKAELVDQKAPSDAASRSAVEVPRGENDATKALHHPNDNADPTYKPRITPHSDGFGGAKITLPAVGENTEKWLEVKVEYTEPNGTAATPVTLTWNGTEWISSNTDVIDTPTKNTDGSYVTAISYKDVKDNSNLIVSVTDYAGNSTKGQRDDNGTAKDQTIPLLKGPTDETKDDPTYNKDRTDVPHLVAGSKESLTNGHTPNLGDVVGKPGGDNEKVRFKFTGSDGNPREIVIKKDFVEGKWVVDTSAQPSDSLVEGKPVTNGKTITMADRGMFHLKDDGTVIIKAEHVQDGSDVEAIGYKTVNGQDQSSDQPYETSENGSNTLRPTIVEREIVKALKDDAAPTETPAPKLIRGADDSALQGAAEIEPDPQGSNAKLEVSFNGYMFTQNGQTAPTTDVTNGATPTEMVLVAEKLADGTWALVGMTTKTEYDAYKAAETNDENATSVGQNPSSNVKLYKVTEDIATIDPKTGKITLKADAIVDNSDVKAKAYNALGEPAAGKDGVSSADNTTTHIRVGTDLIKDKFADKPEIEQLANGDVSVRPKVGGDSTELEVTVGDQTIKLTKPKTVNDTTTKNWSVVEPSTGFNTSTGELTLPNGKKVKVNTETGEIVIPKDSAPAGTTVTAKAKDENDNVSESATHTTTAPTDTSGADINVPPHQPADVTKKPAAPMITPIDDNTENQGGLTIRPGTQGENNTPAVRLEVSYVKETDSSGADKKVTNPATEKADGKLVAVKDPKTGEWSLEPITELVTDGVNTVLTTREVPDSIAVIDKGTGVITLKPNAVLDKSTVSAVAYDTNKTVSETDSKPAPVDKNVIKDDNPNNPKLDDEEQKKLEEMEKLENQQSSINSFSKDNVLFENPAVGILRLTPGADVNSFSFKTLVGSKYPPTTVPKEVTFTFTKQGDSWVGTASGDGVSGFSANVQDGTITISNWKNNAGYTFGLLSQTPWREITEKKEKDAEKHLVKDITINGTNTNQTVELSTKTDQGYTLRPLFKDVWKNRDTITGPIVKPLDKTGDSDKEVDIEAVSGSNMSALNFNANMGFEKGRADGVADYANDVKMQYTLNNNTWSKVGNTPSTTSGSTITLDDVANVNTGNFGDTNNPQTANADLGINNKTTVVDNDKYLRDMEVIGKIGDKSKKYIVDKVFIGDKTSFDPTTPNGKVTQEDATLGKVATPSIEAKTDGGIVAKPNVTLTDATDKTAKFIVEYLTPAMQKVTLEFTRQNGEWTKPSNFPTDTGASFNKTTGEVVLPAALLKDGSKALIKSYDDQSIRRMKDATVAFEAQPSRPDAEATKDGGATVQPKGNTYKFDVEYKDQLTNETKKLTYEKDFATNQWVLKTPTTPVEGVTLDPQSGKVTLKGDIVRGESAVKVNAYNNEGYLTHSNEAVVLRDKFSNSESIQGFNDIGEPIGDWGVERAWDVYSHVSSWDKRWNKERGDGSDSWAAFAWRRGDFEGNSLPTHKEMITAADPIGDYNTNRGRKWVFDNENNVVDIKNSLGSVVLGTQNLDPLLLSFNGGNDILSVGNDLGTGTVIYDKVVQDGKTIEVPQRRIGVDMGEGNDLLIVGRDNWYFDIIRHKATGVLDIVQSAAVTDHWTEKGRTTSDDGQWEMLWDNASNTQDRAKDRFNENRGILAAQNNGGQLINAAVRMGDGDDTVILKGFHSGIGSAASDSIIELGEGHNRLVVAPLDEDNYAVRSTVITAGSGDDWISGPVFEVGTKVQLGAGDDNFRTAHLGNALIEMGTGNDFVSVSKGIYGGARVNMGDGHDVFEQKAWNSQSATIIEGGRGIDFFIMRGATGIDYAQASTENVKGFDRIELADRSVFNVRYKDLVEDKGLEGALKIYAIGDNKYSMKVDLGATQDDYTATPTSEGLVDNSNENGGTEGRWIKQSTQQYQDNRTFDVYYHNTDTAHKHAVWIENGIYVI